MNGKSCALIGWDDWSEPEEDAYVSAPFSQWETVMVRCPNCGRGMKMPMDGPVPTTVADGFVVITNIDWDRLMPFITRFAKGLARSCVAPRAAP